MKLIFLFSFVAFMSICSFSLADNVPVPIVVHQALTPAPAAVVAPLTAVDSDVVPPQWALDGLETVKKLPMIGPIMSKLLVWMSVLVTILTALTGCVIAIIRALSTVMALAPSLVGLAQAVSDFENGKIVYWMKYFSAFNAPKPKV